MSHTETQRHGDTEKKAPQIPEYYGSSPAAAYTVACKSFNTETELSGMS